MIHRLSHLSRSPAECASERTTFIPPQSEGKRDSETAGVKGDLGVPKSENSRGNCKAGVHKPSGFGRLLLYFRS